MCCLFQFPTKINFFIFLAKIRIETYFPLGDPNINFFKPLFSSLANTLMSNVIKKRDLLLANSVTFDDKSSNKSLVQVKNKSGPRNQFLLSKMLLVKYNHLFHITQKIGQDSQQISKYIIFPMFKNQPLVPYFIKSFRYN